MTILVKVFELYWLFFFCGFFLVVIQASHQTMNDVITFGSVAGLQMNGTLLFTHLRGQRKCCSRLKVRRR